MKYYGYNNKSTQMNDWIQMFCKHDGLLVTDLDFVFFDFKKRRLKMIEVKGYNAKIKPWQLNIYRTINSALKAQAEIKKHEDHRDDYEYEGFHVVTLDTDNPETATMIKINDKQVTKEQLIDFLDFKSRFDDLM